MNECRVIVGNVVLLFVLAGCSPVKTPLVTEPPITEAVDCRWRGEGFIWIDKNTDGRYQEGEQPVPGVSFLVDDILNDYVDVGDPSVSNSKGGVDLSVWLPGCPEVEFEVYIQVPEGYKLTTEARISVDFNSTGPLYSFGIALLPGYPTATPLPPKPVCEQYSLLPGVSITDFSVDEGGVAWLSTMGDGLFTYPNGATDRKFIKADVGTENIYINLIKSRYGYLWIATPSGVSSFDGGSWQTYSEEDGLLDTQVNDIAVEEDGSAWFATTQGASYFSRSNNAWYSFTSADGLVGSPLITVEVSADGSIWFAPEYEDSFSRLIWSDRPNGKTQWLLYSGYSKDENLRAPISFIQDTDVDLSGNFWAVGINGFARFNVFKNTWIPKILIDHDAYSLKAVHITAGLDGSAWLTSEGVLYHYFPEGMLGDQEVLLQYNNQDGLPNLRALISMEVAPDGTVWFVTKRQVTNCLFFDGVTN